MSMENKGTARATKRPPATRKKRPNTIFFPRGLREAIPDMPTCGGRLLELSAMTGKTSVSGWTGTPRIEMSFEARETGKLKGVFEVWVDMDLEAARAMAETVRKLVEELDRKGHDWSR